MMSYKFLWFPYDFPMIFLWFPNDFLWFPMISYNFLNTASMSQIRLHVFCICSKILLSRSSWRTTAKTSRPKWDFLWFAKPFGFQWGEWRLNCRVCLIFVCSYYVVFCFKKFNKIKQTPQTLICRKPGLEKIETIAVCWTQSLGLVIRNRLHVSVALGIQNIGISFRKWRSQDKMCSEGGRGTTWKKLRAEPSS